MRKLSDSRLNFLIKDEAKASAEYKALGFPTLAGDEARHKRFLMFIKARRRN